MAEITDSSSGDGVRSRGNVLALLGGAIAGVFAGALGRPEQASGGHDGTDVMHLGQANNAPGGASTHLEANTDKFAFSVRNDHSGVGAGGVLANSFVANTPAIQGSAFGSGSPGVRGDSTTALGISPPDGAGTGVQGLSGTGRGVEGQCPNGIGVFGESNTGTGGTFQSQTGMGAFVRSQSGHALRVEGRAAFSTAGSGTLPQAQTSVFVSNPAVTAGSHISVTLVSDPGGRQLKWVERTPGSGFRVFAPGPANARPATSFTYLIVEAAA